MHAVGRDSDSDADFVAEGGHFEDLYNVAGGVEGKGLAETGHAGAENVD